MPQSNTVNLYLVSDSSGETVLSVGRAVLSQFDNVSANKYMWPMVRTKEQIDKLIGYIQDLPGIILFTLVDTELKNYLLDQANRIQAPCISAIAPVVREIERYLNISAERKVPGGQHANLDDYYFQKIEAIDFTMRHDDGQLLDEVNSADIVLIGVSRTSKTPTCLYLAQRGFKVANIPYVAGRQLGIDPATITGPMVIALTITPERLRVIRENRLVTMGDYKQDAESYSDSQQIKNELREALQLYSRFSWPVLDVSGRAIEETAAEIMSIYSEQKGVKLSRR